MKRSGIKRDALDKLFSLYIRTRDAWTCQRCHTFYQMGSQGLHCSHFIGRRNRAVRWDPDNACAHCYGCHRFLEGNPIEFGDWIQNYLGQERYLALRKRAIIIPRLRKVELQEIYDNLKAKLAEIERAA